MRSREAFAPIPLGRSMLARLLRMPSDEAAPDAGRIARILRGLPEGWFVFGSTGTSGIDHLVAGPGGAFAVSVHETMGAAHLSERALTIDGARSGLLAAAVLEARRAARVLEAASARPVGVRPVLLLSCRDLTVASRPSDVTVLRAGDALSWFRKQPAVLSRETVAAVARAASRPETWG